MTSSQDPHWRARRALDRLAFGPRPGEVAQVAEQGVVAWIRAQLAAPAEDASLAIEVPGWALGRPRDAEARRRHRAVQREVTIRLAAARLAAAFDAPWPLRERMVGFWADHFAVSGRKPFTAVLLPWWDRDVIRRHAFGDFHALLVASARHPAMLFYLDNWQSAAPRDDRRDRRRRARRGDGDRPGRPRGLNENYARELLELHTLGVSGGYDQHDVEAVARALTGWTLRRDGDVPAFHFEAGWHDPTPKRVLGLELRSDGAAEGDEVLERLAAHPSTARFVARKLAVRFLADDPPRAPVERTARAFTVSGGDIRRTLAALLLEGDELFDPQLTKVKTPFELVVSSLRVSGGRPRDGQRLGRHLQALDHVPYRAASPAGHPDVAAAWIDPGAMLRRGRLAFDLARERGVGDGAPDPLEWLAAPVAASTRAALAAPGLRESERLALALASPEFQRR